MKFNVKCDLFCRIESLNFIENDGKLGNVSEKVSFYDWDFCWYSLLRIYGLCYRFTLFDFVLMLMDLSGFVKELKDFLW